MLVSDGGIDGTKAASAARLDIELATDQFQVLLGCLHLVKQSGHQIGHHAATGT
jgi:hypothetical protein